VAVPSNGRPAPQQPRAADPARPVRPVSLQLRAMLAGDDQGGPGRTRGSPDRALSASRMVRVLGLSWGFAGGRCWVRTNVGLADGFTDGPPSPHSKPLTCRLTPETRSHDDGVPSRFRAFPSPHSHQVRGGSGVSRPCQAPEDNPAPLRKPGSLGRRSGQRRQACFTSPGGPAMPTGSMPAGTDPQGQPPRQPSALTVTETASRTGRVTRRRTPPGL
jgi:hypothetical protein